MKNQTISALAEQARDLQIRLGVRADTAWVQYYHYMLPVINLHLERGKSKYDANIVNEYVEQLGERLTKGEINKNHYSQLRLGATRLTEMYENGCLVWSTQRRPSKFVLNKYYERLLTDFLQDLNWHNNTRDDVKWTAQKFFFWLIENGHTTLKNVGADEIQSFIIFCSNTMRPSGLHNIQLYMRRLCEYFHSSGLLPSDFKSLLSFRVNRTTKIFPATSWLEVEAILKTINRLTNKGKRDYAIIILAAVIGLRAVDIAQLKLTDIDWQNGEIKIWQSKTSEPVILPLTEDVGVPLRDYIENARPQTLCNTVFLRLRVPHREFATPMAISNIYNDYRRKAGLPRQPFDGKGFHSLRRGVCTNLITADVPATTIAQILGDKMIDSLKKYTSLDIHHLQECALDLTGIEPEAAHE